METERLVALLATLAVGALIAFQPPANADLGRQVGTLGAAFLSLALSTTIVAILLLASGGIDELRGGLSDVRPVHVMGGIAGAAVVAVTIPTVRELGAGGVTAALVCTQLGVSAILDKVGFLDLEKVGFSPARVIGIALLIAGTFLVTSR